MCTMRGIYEKNALTPEREYTKAMQVRNMSGNYEKVTVTLERYIAC